MKLTFLRAAVCAMALLLLSCGEEEKTKKYVHIPPSMPDSVYAKLQDGDLIMRKGNGPLSFHIMNATKEEYSHCGIIVKDQGKWRVIESIDGSVGKGEIDGVQITDLTEFVRHAGDSMLYICRATFEDSIGTKIRDRAFYYLEKGASFDHSFNLFEHDRIYCSELVFLVLRDITGKNQMKIRKKHKSYLLLFETFFDETKYEKVFHLKDLQ